MNACRTSLFASLAAVAGLLASCSDATDRVSGTDEHGNAVAARVFVVDSTGEPLAGAKVSLRPASWLEGEDLDSSSAEPTGWNATTVSDGSCLLPLGRLEEVRTLSARHGDRAAVFQAGPRGLDNRVLVMRATGSVQGTVVAGSPGTKVRISGVPGVAFLDDSGRFVLSDLPAGMLQLVLGQGAGRTVVESLTVGQGAATLVPALPAPGVRAETLSVADAPTSPLPRPPEFLPAGGVFASAPTIQVRTDLADAILETSLDGRTWSVVTGTLRPLVSVCLWARVTRVDGVVSQPVQACYTIEP